MKKKFTLLFIFCSFSTILKAQQASTCDVSNQGNLQTHPDSQMTFFGNLENTATGNITENGGQVSFTNPNNSLSITGTNTPVFSELFVNVKDSLILEIPVDVSTGLFFEEGLIITPRNTAAVSINLKNDALDANEADLRHVDGYISYNGSQSYDFPVGDDNRLRPISIEASTLPNTYKAAYFFENASNTVTFPLSLDLEEKDDQISNVSPYEFWDLDGSTPNKATLTWDIMSNISQILNANNLSDLIVVGWNIEDQKWENLGNFSVTGNLSAGSITSDTFNPDDYEALTFATNKEEINSDELTVFNGISTGDNNNKNDYLVIANISQFPNNTLKIFNRWGVKVFDVDGYDAEPRDSPNFKEPTNAFVGKSNGRITVSEDDLLPVGTYYYILSYKNDANGDEKTLAGYIYLNR